MGWHGWEMLGKHVDNVLRLVWTKKHAVEDLNEDEVSSLAKNLTIGCGMSWVMKAFIWQRYIKSLMSSNWRPPYLNPPTCLLVPCWQHQAFVITSWNISSTRYLWGLKTLIAEITTYHFSDETTSTSRSTLKKTQTDVFLSYIFESQRDLQSRYYFFGVTDRIPPFQPCSRCPSLRSRKSQRGATSAAVMSFEGIVINYRGGPWGSHSFSKTKHYCNCNFIFSNKRL